MKSPKIILISGNRVVGKDTFFTLLQEINPNFKRWAFADSLKIILEPVCLKLFNKSIKDLTPIEKELFRPIMLATGKTAREIDVNFWVKCVAEEIKLYMDFQEIIPVICDNRYISETNYFKEIYGNSMLLINIDRIGAPEPTSEEKINGPKVKELADVLIEWKTDASLIEPRKTVSYFYDKYFNGYDQ